MPTEYDYERDIDEIEEAQDVERMINQAKEQERERILEIIKNWDRNNKYGTEIAPYKEWSRTKSFGDSFILLLAKINNQLNSKEEVKQKHD